METWREELYHSAKGTTWEKTKHKYIERKLVNGKWIYRYTSDSKRAKENANADRLEEYSKNFTGFAEYYKNAGDPVKANGMARTAQRYGERATAERYKGRTSSYMEHRPKDGSDYKIYLGPEWDYQHSHPVDYYVNKADAFIDRLLKKK